MGNLEHPMSFVPQFPRTQLQPLCGKTVNTRLMGVLFLGQGIRNGRE